MTRRKKFKLTAQCVMEAMKHCTSSDSTRLRICTANIIVESGGQVTLQATNGHILLDIPHVQWGELRTYFREHKGFELSEEATAGRLFTDDKTRKKTGQLWFIPESEAEDFPSLERVRPEGKNPTDGVPKFTFAILDKVKKIYKALGMLDYGFVPDKWDDFAAGEKEVMGGHMIVMGYRIHD